MVDILIKGYEIIVQFCWDVFKCFQFVDDEFIIVLVLDWMWVYEKMVWMLWVMNKQVLVLVLFIFGWSFI